MRQPTKGKFTPKPDYAPPHFDVTEDSMRELMTEIMNKPKAIWPELVTMRTWAALRHREARNGESAAAARSRANADNNLKVVVTTRNRIDRLDIPVIHLWDCRTPFLRWRTPSTRRMFSRTCSTSTGTLAVTKVRPISLTRSTTCSWSSSGTASGDENNLHSHSHLDGVWTVLAGRAKFYGPGDELMADLGPLEGIMLPRGTKYWFESGDESQTLVIHQVEASDIAMVSIQDLIKDRINHAAPKPLLETTLVAPEAK